MAWGTFLFEEGDNEQWELTFPHYFNANWPAEV